jgi:hypothetical protein
MDYLYEAIAMRGRYRRNRDSWGPHLERTRQFVLSSASKCENRGKAVVLGAGLLLDVPLEELSAMFREVALVDIVFLPGVKRTARRFGNVKLLTHDATNVAERLHESIRRGVPELPEPAPDVPELDGSTGLVVSLNILSQLWVMPRAYALGKMRGLDEERLDDWCGRVVESHYAFLRSLPCPVCLVADREFVKRDRDVRIVSRATTLFGLELPRPDESWTWNIAPLGEDRRGLSKELLVGAWHFR